MQIVQGAFKKVIATVSGLNYAGASDVKSLWLKAINNGYMTLVDGAGNGYVVPVGFKLVLFLSKTMGGGTAGIYSCEVGYGDTVVTSAAPTNPITLVASMYLQANTSTGAIMEQNIPEAEIPAGKYPYIRNNSGTPTFNGIVYGYLVKV